MKIIVLSLYIFIISMHYCIAKEGDVISLPEPVLKGSVSVEESIYKRRSHRSYKNESLTLKETGQILWAAQGITDPRGLRAAPSAGATYPLETYLVVGDVEGLEPGMYRYSPGSHTLSLIKKGDIRKELSRAAWGQDMIFQAPASIVFTAIYKRTTQRYGQRGIRYVHMDVGHAGENVHLQAEALGLGTVVIGAFDDDSVAAVIDRDNEQPLYIMPIGRKR